MNESQDKTKGLELTELHFVKELKSIFSDKGAMLILVGAMLIYPVAYAIAYLHETMTDLSVAVVDLDHSVTSRKYSQMIDASAELNVTYNPASLNEARSLFMKNKINGVVVIPSGFEKDVFSSVSTNIGLYADASYFLKYKNEVLAVTYANAYFSAGVSVMRYMAEGQSFSQAKVSRDPLSAHTHILYNPSSGYGSFLMPGVMLVILQQTLLIGIGLMGGSFSESKASPFLLSTKKRWREIIPYLMGKSGAYILLSLFNISFTLVMVQHWFNYPDKADFIDVAMLVFPYLLSVVILGVGLSTLFRHRESAMVFMVFLSPIALFLSGLSWPVSAMPEWLVTISKVMPSSTVVPAYLRLRTMGVGISGIKHELLWLYTQAAVYFVFVLSFFYWRILRDNRRLRKQLI
jgi:ABC-2 type transport system permease protein